MNTGPNELPRQHLKQLTIIRTLLLIFLWCSYFASFWLDAAPLDQGPIVAILIVFCAVYVFTLWRLNNNRAINEATFFGQLLADVFCLIGLFYFSGGASNPFVSYLLVPVCISAATLPWRFTWFITAFSISAYSVLLFFNIPLPAFAMEHAHHGHFLNWHILGMWFNFFVSAILITYFVVKMANSLRQQQAVLNQLREDELRHEQVIAVATLAAGAAHEMNTPLSTMGVLLRELQNDYPQWPQLQQDLQLLYNQTQLCAASLKHWVQEANHATLGVPKVNTVPEFCALVMDKWQLMRPEASFTLDCQNTLNAYTIAYDLRLVHAIINLLNNAIEASPSGIHLQLNYLNNHLEWRIIDTGEGIAFEDLSKLGKQAFSTKAEGLGLGMLLSNTTIKHLGGRLIQQPNKPSGTCTCVILPLHMHTP